MKEDNDDPGPQGVRAGPLRPRLAGHLPHLLVLPATTTPATWASVPCGSSTRTGCSPAGASAPTRTRTWRSSPTCSPGRWRTGTAWAPAARIRPGELQRMTAGTGITPQRVQSLGDRAGPPLPDLAAARAGGAGAVLRAEGLPRGGAAQPAAAGRLARRARRLADDPPGRPALPRHAGRGPRGLARAAARAATPGCKSCGATSA